MLMHAQKIAYKICVYLQIFPGFCWGGVGTGWESETDCLEEPAVGSDPVCKHFYIVAMSHVKCVRVSMSAFALRVFL